MKREAVRVPCDAEHLGRVRRRARTGHVPCDHREVVGQHVDLVTPSRRTVTDVAVQEHERRTPAGALIRHPQPVDVDRVHQIGEIGRPTVSAARSLSSSAR